MNHDHTAEPTVAEIAALTARLRDLSHRSALASDAERAAFVADKDALLARIAKQHWALDDEGSAVWHEHSALTPLQATHANLIDQGSPPMSAEDAAHDLAADLIPLDQARAMVADYLDTVSDQIGCSVHQWGLDAADIADIRQTSRGDEEAERRAQLARWRAEDKARMGVDEHVMDRDDGTTS